MNFVHQRKQPDRVVAQRIDSKVMALGLPLTEVIRASTTAPMQVCNLPTENLLSPGTRAEFTLFDVIDADLQVTDSMRDPVRMTSIIEPRFTVIGAEAIPAARHQPAPQALCQCCGQPLPSK